MEARALARLGDARACERALAAAERSFGQANPGEDPEFISYFNEAELADEFGHCFRDLGQAGRAVEYASRVVASSDGEYRAAISSARWSWLMGTPTRTSLSRRARPRSPP
jgi:hypothetical protein